MPGYANAVVYVIKNSENPKVYVGSTINGIKARMNEHKKCAKTETRQNTPLYEAMSTLGFEKFTIELVERFPCENMQELKKREAEVTRQLDAFTNGYNKRIEDRTAAQYTRDYYAAHPEKMRELARNYYHRNVDARLEANKDYRVQNAEQIRAQRKQYREANKDKIVAVRLAYKERKRVAAVAANINNVAP